MRSLLLPFVLLAASCASRTVPDFGPGELTVDLFPLTARSLEFVTTNGEARRLRVEPGPGADIATLTVSGDGFDRSRTMTIRRMDGSLYFSSGPGAATELLRIGAEPGTAWQSGAEEVRFAGWERIDVPAGVFDAARITTRRGSAQIARLDSWWFVVGEGLVRFRTDQGGLLVEEMLRVTPPGSGSGGDE